MKSSGADVSIIICTSNRAESLRQTLAKIGQLRVPRDTCCELVVVDNASTDDTAQIVDACSVPDMAVHSIHEPKRGKGHAYNAALSAARGDILLFTDDDVHPPRDWIQGMTAPILKNEAQAVMGGVRLAPHLERGWMTPLHREWLADTHALKQKPTELIGANMAFARAVLHQVPAFDTELGPGALGLMEDTLFSMQLREANCCIAQAFDVEVEHHFDAARLQHKGFSNHAARSARSWAYVEHHWRHRRIALLGPRLIKSRLALLLEQIRSRREQSKRAATPREGIGLREMQALWSFHFFQQFIVERRRPRNYDKHGLTKLTA